MVIQRWQSLLLFIAAAMMVIFSFCSLGQFQTPTESLNISAMGINVEGDLTSGQPTEVANTLYIFVVSLLTVILPLLNIFFYKNFRLQKRLCLINILCIVVTMAEVAYICYARIPYNPSWSSAVISPFIALVATYSAFCCIKSDEKKLKDSDRLR